MAKRKLIHVRKPKIRLTGKGLKVTKPSARIGGKAGINISSKGVSASVRTGVGTISTRKGKSTLGKPRKRKKGCGLLILVFLVGTILAAANIAVSTSSYATVLDDPTPSTFNYLPIIAYEATPTSAPAPTNTPTPTPTSTPAPVSTGNIVITNIYYDGAGSSEPDEYVEIRNDDTGPIQMQNWTLRDAADHTYVFPNHTMQPDQTCRIYTNENHPEWCGFNYGSNSAIWNNGGDTAYLRDSSNTLIDTYSY